MAHTGAQFIIKKPERNCCYDSFKVLGAQWKKPHPGPLLEQPLGVGSGVLKQFQRKAAFLSLSLAPGWQFMAGNSTVLTIPLSGDTPAHFADGKAECQGKGPPECPALPESAQAPSLGNGAGQASSGLCNRSHYPWLCAKNSPVQLPGSDGAERQDVARQGSGPAPSRVCPGTPSSLRWAARRGGPGQAARSRGRRGPTHPTSTAGRPSLPGPALTHLSAGLGGGLPARKRSAGWPESSLTPRVGDWPGSRRA